MCNTINNVFKKYVWCFLIVFCIMFFCCTQTANASTVYEGVNYPNQVELEIELSYEESNGDWIITKLYRTDENDKNVKLLCKWETRYNKCNGEYYNTYDKTNTDSPCDFIDFTDTTAKNNKVYKYYVVCKSYFCGDWVEPETFGEYYPDSWYEDLKNQEYVGGFHFTKKSKVTKIKSFTTSKYFNRNVKNINYSNKNMNISWDYINNKNEVNRTGYKISGYAVLSNMTIKTFGKSATGRRVDFTSEDYVSHFDKFYPDSLFYNVKYRSVKVIPYKKIGNKYYLSGIKKPFNNQKEIKKYLLQ